jgi:hypothetical protein
VRDHPKEESNILFQVVTPLGFSVRTTASHWNLITTVKHPIMQGREADVKLTLSEPDEVRQSKSDDAVYLFYRFNGEKRWVCAVARQLNGDGFLITAYRTSAIKEGREIWQK